MLRQMKALCCTGIALFLCAALSAQTQDDQFARELAVQALLLTEQKVVYDPAYYSMAYPNGDVPEGKGVCTDIIIRAYRALGIDLQQEVHEDMRAHFELYPRIWGLNGPDSNIDHRRVPNLMTYFKRHGVEKPISYSSADYAPGDIVCWNLGGAVTHIGIVADSISAHASRPLIVHNIGSGQVLEDCLFDFRIIGHYIYHGK